MAKIEPIKLQYNRPIPQILSIQKYHSVGMSGWLKRRGAEFRSLNTHSWLQERYYSMWGRVKKGKSGD
jgi:hypothetical protein